MKNLLITPLLLAGCLASIGAVAAEKAPAPAGAPGAVPVEMQQMMKAFSPELRKKAMALSPQTKATLAQLHAGHQRRAKETTLRQVMHEILVDYQAIAAALATDNAEMASEAARRLANHRIPKGGLLPYFALENVNDADLASLPVFNDVVEGSAIKLADAADAGDLPRASAHMSDIMGGCVACHQKFRHAKPGVTANLISPLVK